MILRFMHWAASHGWVYDLIQVVCGADKVYSAVAARVAVCARAGGVNSVVLDIGGGTGTLRNYLKFDCRYVCLDNEAPKLQRFQEKFPGGLALLGDAMRLPMPDRSVDVAVCTMVAHHLPEEVLIGFFQECRRVLRDDGSFVFLDWLVREDRLISRILRRLDRGANPYTPERLQYLLKSHFDIGSAERFTVLNEYLVAVVHKSAAAKA
jgi:ubiquinone/menaquinone biosynthesis C-methylase UbiE